MLRKIIIITLILACFSPLAAAAAKRDTFDNQGRGDLWNLILYGTNSASGGTSGGLNAIANETYGRNADEVQSLPLLVYRLINIFLGLLGVIFLIIILYAGFEWMTAGGNEEQISKAKGLIKNGIIGLLIILAAFSITLFVFRAVAGAAK